MLTDIETIREIDRYLQTIAAEAHRKREIASFINTECKILPYDCTKVNLTIKLLLLSAEGESFYEHVDRLIQTAKEFEDLLHNRFDFTLFEAYGLDPRNTDGYSVILNYIIPIKTLENFLVLNRINYGKI